MRFGLAALAVASISLCGMAVAEPSCEVVASPGTAPSDDAIAEAIDRGGARVGAGDRAGAARAYLEAAGLAEDAGDGARQSLALGSAGSLYLDDGRLAEARTLTRRALFLAAEAELPQLVYRWQWQIARLHARQGQAGDELELLRQAAATLEGLGAGLGDAGPDARALLRSLARALLDRADATEDPPRRAGLLREARNALERLKAEELRDYFRDPCLAAQRETPAESVPGALVVYPVVLEDRLELLVSRGDRIWSHRVEIDAETLQDTIRRLRRELQRRATFRFRLLAERVYSWLIAPLEPELDAGIDTLVFVPDGILRTIPIGALRDASSERYLIERIPVAVVPALRLIEPRAIATAKAEVLVAGVSESRDGFPALERVPQELEAVHAGFSGVRLLDTGFSVDALSRQLETRAFDIVHIASHGEFSPRGGESFVLAYDRRIGMDELAELVGVTRFRDRGLELLTLSACETAAGDERAALGLAGIAVKAGARSALATLWAVDDDAATDLIARFYAQLRQPGVSRARALQRAQIHLLRETPYRHPAFWSPFLLINSWL